MTHNPRNQITFTISAMNLWKPAYRKALLDVCSELSTVTGGCNLVHGTGFWTSEAVVESEERYNSAQMEPSATITVTTIGDPQQIIDIARRAMRDLFAGLSIDWIDCNVTEVSARHFSIKA